MATIDPIASDEAPIKPAKYDPNRVLGRSGYEGDPETRLGMTLESLDGLLCLLTMDCAESDPGNDFQRMNPPMQGTVLQLASDLAHQAHELHLQLHVYREGRPQ